MVDPGLGVKVAWAVETAVITDLTNGFIRAGVLNLGGKIRLSFFKLLRFLKGVFYCKPDFILSNCSS